MKKSAKIRGVTFILFLMLLPAILPSVAGTAPLSGSGHKTITRQFDHIIIKGKALTAHLGKAITPMRLYAFKAGKMQPIPFQIDERTEKGHWVLTQKSPFLSEKKRSKMRLNVDEPPLIFDENDELAFMIRDTGSRAASTHWPPGYLIADEIVLADPLTGEHSWAYLFSFAGQKKRSPVDYVDYRISKRVVKDRLYADNYIIGFSHTLPISWDYLQFTNDKDNILDRLKIRIHSTVFHFFKLYWTEHHLESRLWQYKDGPIRVIRMVRSSIKLIAGLKSPGVYSETVYYKNAVLLPFRIKLNFSPKGIVQDTFFDSGLDYRNCYGWKLKLNTDGRWLNIDGNMDDAENSIESAGAEGARWYILKGPAQSIVASLHVLGEFDIKREFSYLDDKLVEHPPEYQPGQVPYIGYKVLNLENLPKGTFRFFVINYYLNRDYSEQEIMRAIDSYSNPIKVSIRGYPQ